MLSNGKDLYSFLDSLLLPKGFVRKKGTYYYKTAECTCWLAVVKSDVGGGEFGHVMACVVNAIDPDNVEYPKYYQSHIKYNLRQLADKELVDKVFNLENSSFTGEEREKAIKDLIEKHAIPFLMLLSTVDGIKKAMKEHKEFAYRATGVLLDYLKTQAPK